MISLYELTADQYALLNALEESEGELTPEIEEQLAINESNFSEKAEGYAKYIKNISAEIDALKSEAKRMSDRAASLTKKQEYLKNMMKSALNVFGYSNYTAGVFKYSLRNSTVCVLDDEAQIPENFKTYEVKISKTDIKNAIKAGEEVAGAHLEDNQSLILR